MFVFINLLSFLTVLSQAQSYGNKQNSEYLKPRAFHQQSQLPNPNNNKDERNMNNMQRNYQEPKQLSTDDAATKMKSSMSSMQMMKKRDMFLRTGDTDNREREIPKWSVPRVKDRLYTETNVLTKTEVPEFKMKWSKYIDMPLYNKAVPSSDTGMKTPVRGMGWSKEIDISYNNRARVTKNNPTLKLQVNSLRRSYNQDNPQSRKSEIPTDELRKTLKNMDEQLAEYKNGIGLFKPNYFRDNPKIAAIKNQDWPIDTKVHTMLKALKTRRMGTRLAPVEYISDISI